MDCKKAKELIMTDYIDGRLLGTALKEVETHIASCADCRALAGELAKTLGAFKTVKPEAAPSGLWYKIRAEISAEPAGQFSARRLFVPVREMFSHIRPAVAAAAAVMILLFVLTAIRLAPNSSQDEIVTLASFNGNGDEAEYDLGTPAEEYFL